MIGFFIGADYQFLEHQPEVFFRFEKLSSIMLPEASVRL